MGLSVLLQDEDGRTEAEFHAPGFDPRILDHVPSASACLRFVDPYGDTIFNQLQVPVLEAELRAVRDGAADRELRTNVEALLAFLRTAHQVHTYVRIVGD